MAVMKDADNVGDSRLEFVALDILSDGLPCLSTIFCCGVNFSSGFSGCSERMTGLTMKTSLAMSSDCFCRYLAVSGGMLWFG